MGASKNDLIKQQIEDSPAKCPNCKFNWDDKFYEYCPKHQAELEELDFEPPY